MGQVQDLNQHSTRKEILQINMPFTSYGKFIASGHALKNDVILLDSALLELPCRAVDERINDLFVPTCVYDADAKIGAVILDIGRHKSFNSLVYNAHGCLELVLGAWEPISIQIFFPASWTF